jgi:hypothetical protein
MFLEQLTRTLSSEQDIVQLPAQKYPGTPGVMLWRCRKWD